MKGLLIILALLLTGCAAQPQQVSEQQTEDASEAQKFEKALTEALENESADRDAIYYLQHRALPDWTHDSDGNFYDYLMDGQIALLREAATEIVNENYAQGISIRPMPERNAVLITFPEPQDLVLCYYALVVKKKDGSFDYFTYERTIQYEDSPFIGVLGSWDKDGAHGNFGPRGYLDEEKFIKDALVE